MEHIHGPQNKHTSTSISVPRRARGDNQQSQIELDVDVEVASGIIMISNPSNWTSSTDPKHLSDLSRKVYSNVVLRSLCAGFGDLDVWAHHLPAPMLRE